MTRSLSPSLARRLSGDQRLAPSGVSLIHAASFALDNVDRAGTPESQPFVRDWIVKLRKTSHTLPQEVAMLAASVPCVLVVDDEAVVRRLVCAILERAGFAVLEGGSGAEALNVFQQHRSVINLLLTDIIMPGMQVPIW